MKKFNFIIPLFVIYAFFTGCEKHESLLESKVENENNSYNYLAFNSIEHFYSCYSDPDKNNIQKFALYPNFKSMLDCYNEIFEAKNDNEISDKINHYSDIVTIDYKNEEVKLKTDNLLLAAILSSEGLVKIGSDIYYINGNKVRYAPSDKLNDLNVLFDESISKYNDIYISESYIKEYTNLKSTNSSEKTFQSGDYKIVMTKKLVTMPPAMIVPDVRLSSYKYTTTGWWIFKKKKWVSHKTSLTIRFYVVLGYPNWTTQARKAGYHLDNSSYIQGSTEPFQMIPGTSLGQYQVKSFKVTGITPKFNVSF